MVEYEAGVGDCGVCLCIQWSTRVMQSKFCSRMVLEHPSQPAPEEDCNRGGWGPIMITLS